MFSYCYHVITLSQYYRFTVLYIYNQIYYKIIFNNVVYIYMYMYTHIHSPTHTHTYTHTPIHTLTHTPTVWVLHPHIPTHQHTHPHTPTHIPTTAVIGRSIRKTSGAGGVSCCACSGYLTFCSGVCLLHPLTIWSLSPSKG